MYIVLLELCDGTGKARAWMEGHRQWIERGFADGVFLLVGDLGPKRGGGIVAHNTTLDELQRRVAADPFVAEKIVTAEIVEITASRTDARLRFLLEAADVHAPR